MKKTLLILLPLLAAIGLSAVSPYNALGDTLTVIMKPILNVPAIHIPGETLNITCIAPSTTTNWQAQLRHGNKTATLDITGSQYLTSPNRWELQATVPQVPVYELYDLRVTASGGIDDTTENAVQLLPTRKINYYFIHISDLHLPTRIYYPDAGFDSDSTSVNDFRSVIDDINLINPEFVLLTGDLLNEGELEGFAGQYWYGWSQRLIEELQVPCFVVNGNHDIGGWDDTPPADGSSRKSWWRYYGWPWLDNPDSNWHQHTQDYDFVYGALHFIGLESYDNYDYYRPNIYGSQSFIYDQMLWLNNMMALYPDKTRVLFYHYDFSDQLNLSTLGADMGLWGHIHSNSGSTSTYPYSLATRSTCDGNRAYRMIRVNGTQLAPQSSIYAGSYGTNLVVSYYPSNTAIADSVMATFSNGQNQAFENALLKFRMPAGNHGYIVTNGSLEQVDRSTTENVCYVKVNIAANSVKHVSIVENSSPVEDSLQPVLPIIESAYPNPFGDAMHIRLDSRLGKGSIRIYNLRGELIRDLGETSGSEPCVWDGKGLSGTKLPAGIYLLRASIGEKSEYKRVIKF